MNHIKGRKFRRKPITASTTAVAKHNINRLRITMSFTFKTISICTVELLLICILQCAAEEACETIPTEIHVTKEEYDDMGRLIRSCSGEVSVNKCEGMCSSQMRPSISAPTGFSKECFCCRENFLRERLVTLTHCYDPDGIRLDDEDSAIMEVRLREPDDCKCYKCGDFSR